MNSTKSDDNRSLIYWVIAIAALAFFLCLAYQAGMVAFGGSFHNGSDSGKYLRVAHGLLLFGVEPDSERLPLYNYFIFVIFKLVGSESLRAVATVQAALGAFIVAAIALAARAFARELVIPAALTAAILPNFIIYSSYILTETVFLLFMTWGLAAMLWAINARRAFLLQVIAGICFGLTLLTRPTVMYLPLFIVPALIYAFRTSRGSSWRSSIGLALVPSVTMWLIASPLLINNYLQYGYFTLTSQPGGHLLYWVYGCLATSWPCADRGSVVAMMAPIAKEQIRAAFGENANPFQASVVMQKLAIERILTLPKFQLIFGMAWGAFRNLMQTSFYEVFHQFNQTLTSYSTMHAPTVLGRLKEFVVVNWNNPLMVMWTLSQATLVVSRVVQILGTVTGVASPRFRALTVLLLAFIAYILALNGPIADPKYRLPIEPALIILFALALTYNPLLLAARNWLVSRYKTATAHV